MPDVTNTGKGKQPGSMNLSHVSAILLCLQAVVIELTIRTVKNISCHHDGNVLRTCPKNLCKISVLLVGSNGF